MDKDKLIRFILLSVSLVCVASTFADNKQTYIQDFTEPVNFKSFQLQDLELNPITPDYFKPHWDWVFMGYTHCPDVCPTTLMVIANALKIIAATEGDAHNTRVTFMSVDPARDHPEKLKKYIRYFHHDFKGMAGPINTLHKIAADMNMTFYYSKPNSEGNYSVAHSSGIAIIDPEGRIAALIKNPNDSQRIAELFMIWRKKKMLSD